MQILDRAVELMRAHGADGPRVSEKLEALAALGDKAARIWKAYIDAPGAAGDKYTLISWVGAERARELYALHLDAQRLVDEICAAAGSGSRFLVLDESPIVMAYVQLKEGETGPQAAQDRLAAQQAHCAHLRSLATAVRNVKSGTAKLKTKAAATKPAKKKSSAKKAAKKAAAKKGAAKKLATKKPAKTSKKPAKKKK
jgi:hypothetical protein